MILVRNIFQAQLGKGGELAALMVQTTQQMAQELGGGNRWRVLTDLSGPFDTVVIEVEEESLAAAEQRRAQLFRSAASQAGMRQTQGMIHSGRNELFTIEAQG
jgi:hypothetical protein